MNTDFTSEMEDWTNDDWEQYVKDMKDYFDGLEEFVRITKIKQMENGFDENRESMRDIL